MTNKKKQKKNFLDPALTYSLTAFTVRAVAQSIVGWMGLEFFKAGIKKTKEWCDDEKSNSQGISEKKPEEKT